MYLTPDTAPGTNKCRVLLIPDDKTWLALVTGALSELTHAYNYEQFGTLTPQETAEAFQTILQSLEDCQPTLTDLVIAEQREALNVNGGDMVASVWNVRKLNTLVADTGGIATLANNRLTLPAGTYRFRAYASTYNVVHSVLAIINYDTSTVIYQGPLTYVSDATVIQQTHISGRFTLASQTQIYLGNLCSQSQSGYGQGAPLNMGLYESYASLWLERE